MNSFKCTISVFALYHSHYYLIKYLFTKLTFLAANILTVKALV